MRLPMELGTHFDPRTGGIEGIAPTERRLSELRGCFFDAAAYEAILAVDDPVVYRVSSYEPGEADGALHYGVGWIAPGRVGDEYFLTRGHLHAWRDAAELYIGLRGTGLMLLEDEDTGATESVPLSASSAVYVPGRTAHRTVNTGEEPLVYIGVYPARAGHDYGVLREHNFGIVAVATSAGPAVLARDAALERLVHSGIA